MDPLQVSADNGHYPIPAVSAVENPHPLESSGNLSTRSSTLTLPFQHDARPPVSVTAATRHFSPYTPVVERQSHWAQFRASLVSHVQAARHNLLQRISRTYRRQSNQALELVQAARCPSRSSTVFKVPVIPLTEGIVPDNAPTHISQLNCTHDLLYLDQVNLGGQTYFELGLSPPELIETGTRLDRPVLITNATTGAAFIVQNGKLLTRRNDRQQALQFFWEAIAQPRR